MLKSGLGLRSGFSVKNRVRVRVNRIRIWVGDKERRKGMNSKRLIRSLLG